MIDPDADRPVHRQLADLLRTHIRRGVLQPGDRLSAEHRLAQEHGVGRDSVRAAIAILRMEGLVDTRSPQGTVVRKQPERRPVRIQRGSTLTVRIPSAEERREHGVPEGVALVELVHPGGRVELLRSDEVQLHFA